MDALHARATASVAVAVAVAVAKPYELSTPLAFLQRAEPQQLMPPSEPWGWCRLILPSHTTPLVAGSEARCVCPLFSISDRLCILPSLLRMRAPCTSLRGTLATTC
jgi:hypothetical protein